MSVIIPTLNSARTLTECLESTRGQRFDGSVEVVVADGGSSDGTIEIANRYGCTVVENPIKTGEAGKARALKSATGDIIALIDSDNILTGPDWLARMTAPFEDPEIAGTEPLRYEYRHGDPALTRYCALLGMNDSLCHFLGNYDRIDTLSGRWTGLDIDSADRGEYLEITLTPEAIPTMGANGFLVRKELLDLLEIVDYLFNIDVIHDLVMRGHNRFAKVKIGIIHIYGSGLVTFTRKQLRRVRDFNYYRSLGMRSYPWSSQKRTGLLRFIIYCVLVFPLIFQSLKGYARKPDPAWALHAPACLITLVIEHFRYTG